MKNTAEYREDLWKGAAEILNPAAADAEGEARSLMRSVKKSFTLAVQHQFWPKYFSATNAEALAAAYRELEIPKADEAEIQCATCLDTVNPGEEGEGPCGKWMHRDCYEANIEAKARCAKCNSNH